MNPSVRRRSFLTLLGGAAASWPLAAKAQQRSLPVIGYLSGRNPGSSAPPEFHQGLSQAGYVEGRNVAVEYHWVGAQFDRLPALAEDLVRRQVSVIVADGLPATRAAKASAITIPIVFMVGVDPVGAGLIDNLSRPGANLTGVTTLAQELEAKKLELLHEAVPSVSSIVALLDPAGPGAPRNAANLQVAARTLVSYGSDGREPPQTAGFYAGRILKGEKPTDLPVQQVTRVKLVINMKAAKAMGITFPLTLLGRADEVIE